MNKTKRPFVIFISGLPRSGTTLVQSEIVRLFEVESDPEPWILPHLLGGMKYQAFSTIGSVPAKNYFRDFLASNKMKDEQSKLLANYVGAVYRERIFRSESEYYLDKTPRNLFFLPEIKDLSCTKASIIVQRHPADVMLSIDELWGGWAYSFFMLKHDFEEGSKAIINADAAHKILRYEDFVTADNREVMLKYMLDLPQRVDTVLPQITGKAKPGDPNFNKKYREISSASVYRFKSERVSLFQALIYRRFLKKKSMQTYIARFYPETIGHSVQFSIRKGLGIKYLIGYSISVLAQRLPLKVLRFNIKEGFMFR